MKPLVHVINALLELLSQGGNAFSGVIAETFITAVDTTAGAARSIAVGAGESGIERNLMHPAAESFFQIGIESTISFSVAEVKGHNPPLEFTTRPD